MFIEHGIQPDGGTDMHKDEFKRRLRQLVREELARTDMRALIHEVLVSMEDFQTIVHEALHEQCHMTSASTKGPVQPRVLH